MRNLRALACSLALALATIVGACAQASGPPGGPPDRSAPRIVSTVPEQGAVLTDFRGPVRVRFDETLSERGTRTDELVLVSPETPDIDVHRGGREVRIQPKGGWQRGRVYHVTVLPGLQDRFGNARNNAFELVFSTGPAIASTALGGIVTDRLTGKPVTNARVIATSTTDSVAYATLTDSAGFYALRSLPVGRFNVVAFVDQNRNRKLDNLEPRQTSTAAIASVSDTAIAEFSVLALDTTPARLLRAEARDSEQVRLVFDDFMEQAIATSGVRVFLYQLPDSILLSGVLMTPREFDARRNARRDTTAVPPRVPAGVAANATADTSRVLPTQELIWSPTPPMAPRTRFRVTVTGVRNINGVPSGGGSVLFESPSRLRVAPPADTTKRPVTKPDTTKPATLRPPTPQPTTPREPVNPRKPKPRPKPDSTAARS